MNRPPLVEGEAAQPPEGGTEAGLCGEAAARRLGAEGRRPKGRRGERKRPVQGTGAWQALLSPGLIRTFIVKC